MFTLAIQSPFANLQPDTKTKLNLKKSGKSKEAAPPVFTKMENLQPDLPATFNQAEQLVAQNPYTAAPLDAEAQIIARAQAGDQMAFAILVERHQDFVYNLAYRILQNYDEADDATQEAFVKIWQALAGFRGEARFTTWAYRIIRNTCLNRLRSAKSGPRMVSVETSFEEGDEEERDIIANLPGSQVDEPAFHFDSLERRQAVWVQVDALPLKYREIIALYYDQEMSYEEIGQALEIPVGTVKTHLFRAKAQLKARLLELQEKGAI